MKKIVISEFMDQATVDGLKRDFTVVYVPELVDQPDLLSAELKTAQAIIVRNRTQVRGDLLTCAKRLKAVGRLALDWIISIWPPASPDRLKCSRPMVQMLLPLPSMSSPQSSSFSGEIRQHKGAEAMNTIESRSIRIKSNRKTVHINLLHVVSFSLLEDVKEF